MPVGRRLKGFSGTLLVTSDTIYEELNRAAVKAKSMVEAGAFLHCYSRYGLSAEMLQSVLQRVLRWSSNPLEGLD